MFLLFGGGGESFKSLGQGAGTLVALWVKCLTLDICSGHDLRVVSSSLVLDSALGMGPTLKKKKKKTFRSVVCVSIFL